MVQTFGILYLKITATQAITIALGLDWIGLDWIGLSYTNNTGMLDPNLFTGSDRFQVKEVQVFQITI
jgi:hypothetical protein